MVGILLSAHIPTTIKLDHLANEHYLVNVSQVLVLSFSVKLLLFHLNSSLSQLSHKLLSDSKLFHLSNFKCSIFTHFTFLLEMMNSATEAKTSKDHWANEHCSRNALQVWGLLIITSNHNHCHSCQLFICTYLHSAKNHLLHYYYHLPLT